MNALIRIEPAKPEDAAAILEIHAAAVHQTAAPYYPTEVIQSWSRLPMTIERIERFQRNIASSDEWWFVAKQSEQILGFGCFDANHQVQGLYVHPNCGRRGIGSQIFAVLEQTASSLGMSYFQVDASINAEAFYQKQGFKTIEYATHRLNSGQEMACVKMQKTFITDLALN